MRQAERFPGGRLRAVLGCFPLFFAADVGLTALLDPTFVCLATSLESALLRLFPGSPQLFIVLALVVATLLGGLMGNAAVRLVLFVLAQALLLVRLVASRCISPGVVLHTWSVPGGGLEACGDAVRWPYVAPEPKSLTVS